MTYDLAVLEQKIKRERVKLARLSWLANADGYFKQADVLDALYKKRREKGVESSIVKYFTNEVQS